MIMPKAKEPPRPPANPSRKGDAAFDAWLQRGLQELYGKVAQEPIPDALLKVIEEDREQ